MVLMVENKQSLAMQCPIEMGSSALIFQLRIPSFLLHKILIGMVFLGTVIYVLSPFNLAATKFKSLFYF